MEKSCRKCVLEASPWFLFVFGNKLKQSCLQEFFFLKKNYSERGKSKSRKKFNFIFFTKPSPI